MGAFTPPEETVVFRIPRQLVRDILEAEAEMLQVKTNLTRQNFITLSRALLTAMEAGARADAEKARRGG